MEQFNRIEIKGIIGNVRYSNFSDSSLANVSVATNYMYKTREGQAVAETTWFIVLVREGKVCEDVKKLKKGLPVYVTGRFKTRNFTDSDGIERQAYEVVANRIDILSEDGSVVAQ